MVSFTWDPRKALLNQQKHAVTFEEAQTVFYDENATLYFDEDHSDTEDRYLLLGMSTHSNILVISHCYSENDDVIRIISARKATALEVKEYVLGNER